MIKPLGRNPTAVANLIQRIGADTELRDGCLNHFDFPESEISKVNLAALCFVSSTASAWALTQNDSTLCEVCVKACEILANKLADRDTFVRVGDYFSLPLELAAFTDVLERDFYQRIPIPNAEVPNFPQLFNMSVGRYEVSLPTLMKVAFSIRREAYFRVVKYALDKSIEDKAAHYILLAHLFSEWITGNYMSDLPRESAEQFQFRCITGSSVLREYSIRTTKALDAL